MCLWYGHVSVINMIIANIRFHASNAGERIIWFIWGQSFNFTSGEDDFWECLTDAEAMGKDYKRDVTIMYKMCLNSDSGM